MNMNIKLFHGRELQSKEEFPHNGDKLSKVRWYIAIGLVDCINKSSLTY